MLLAWLLKSTALLAVTWALSLLLGRARAAHRHLFWLSGIGGSALLATASFWPKAPASMAFDFEATPIIVNAVSTLPSPSTTWPWAMILPAIWLAGVLLLVVRIVVDHVRAQRLLKNAIHTSGNVWLSNATRVPFTAGLFRPRIVLPIDAPEWPRDRLEMVLAHERAHAARFDCLTQLLAELHAACAWPNPFVWMARRRLLVERELAADDAVLATGSNVRDYATLLLEYARVPSGAAAAMAAPSTLVRRIEVMLSGRSRPLPAWLTVAAAGTISVSAVFVGCDATPDMAAQESQSEALEPQGSLDPVLIKDEMRRHGDWFRGCYEAALHGGLTRELSVKLHFTITADGATEAITMDGLEDAPNLTRCFRNVVAGIEFAKPKGGGKVIVNYPLLFKPADGDDEEDDDDDAEDIPLFKDGVRLTLGRDDVLSTVKAVADDVRRCLDAGRTKKIITKWRIVPSGAVEDVHTENASPAEDACVTNVLRKMRFPAYRSGTIPVTFPFI